MTLIFDPNNLLQNDQTAGTQTTSGDTDIAYGDTRLDILKLAVSASGYTADTGFATLVSGAYQQDVMTITGEGDVGGLKFVDPTGGTLNGDPSGLKTVSGEDIRLYSNSDGTIVYGVYGSGTLAFAVQIPLFIVLFGGIALGVLVGFIWEWAREHKHRSVASKSSRQVARLERELAVMRDSSSVPKDEVLALLDKPAAK